MTPRPKSPYALQKLTGEYYCSVFAGCFGLETVSLRYFNVYGPRQDPSSPYSGVLSLFCKADACAPAPDHLRRWRDEPRFHLSSKTWSDLNMKAAACRRRMSPGKVYNGGNGGRITLNEAWELLQKIEGVTFPAQYGPRAPATFAIRRPTHAWPCATWGTIREFSFERGLRLTLDWYRTQ